MATAEEKAAPSKGKMKGLVILIVVGIIAAGGGYATPLILKKFTEKHTENVKENTGADALKLAFIPFDTVVVNINEANLGRFLRIKAIIVVDEPREIEVTELIAKNKAILKNWLIGHLSDKSMQDVAGAAGVHRSRREILDQFNTLLFPDGSDKIRDILFEEFNVQ
jgi:flagellar basal body-associated protein FliL